MLTIRAKGVSSGVAIGRARLVRRERVAVGQRTVEDAEAEWRRFQLACDAVADELERLAEQALRTLGQEGAQLFSVHAMIVRDEDLQGAVRDEILGHHQNAEYAVSEAAARHASVFANMEDEYMRERAADVKDVADRILRHLHPDDGGAGEACGEAGDIICAEDLTPGETVELDRASVSAFVTAGGSANSHTAILARTMGLPAVVGVGTALERMRDGMTVAVDAESGTVYLEPDAATLHSLRLRMEQNARARELLLQYRGRESCTVDGRRIEICANVGNLQDVEEAQRVGADGIGLFRSEFLYMGRDDLPSEQEQFEAYRRALQAMPDRRVVVRTLDIGADKQARCLGLPQEQNPALGLRAIRISLCRPELFLTQARALLRASRYGRLAVMFPLVVSVDEVVRLKALWSQAEEQLRREKVPFAERVEMGIMIETPAAALISDRLAALVDFFSIGTNDLTQYTLALDRQNAALEEFCDPRHEAVLRLIRMTVENGHKAGIWVGVCGELGADLSLTEELLRMGIDELSVTPPALLALRERVCTMRIKNEKS